MSRQRQLRLLHLGIVSCLLSGCAASSRYPEREDPGPLRFFALEGRTIFYLHVIPSAQLRREGQMEEFSELGRIAAYPTRFSKNNHDEVLESKRYYEGGNYEAAAGALERPVLLEPRNPFILNEIARAFYWTDKDRSFDYYDRLISYLDNQSVEQSIGIQGTPPPQYYPVENRTGADPDTVLIDCWFMEAYWKYGTLLLDRGEYRHAAYEISRMLFGAMFFAQSTLADQALTWLAEAWMELGEYAPAKHYALWALRLNPSNSTARTYLIRANRALRPPEP